MTMNESIFNLIQQHNAAQPAGRKQIPDKIASYLAGDEDVVLPRNPAQPRAPAPATTNRGNPMPNMADYNRAQDAANQAPAPRERKQTTKPLVANTLNRPRELDATEIARRRQLNQNSGAAMAHAMGGGAPVRRPMRSESARNMSRDHLNSVKEQSIVNGLMKQQGQEPQSRPAARRPEFSGKSRQLPEGQVDRVEQNKRDVEKDAARKAVKAAPVPHFNPKARPAGRIPKYLVERKIEAEVDQMMAAEAAERAKGPPPMPEHERLATLAALNVEREKCTKELILIPPSKLELGTYARQAKTLNLRLTEIDQAIAMFSKKKVYVN
ncbi:hypothetical protein T484DRAFT_1933256 [Baffinella frigidus]|nr:hypothetical protein T484DRAFT_1933256 [Cryptophyta sp. CCMP2293]